MNIPVSLRVAAKNALCALVKYSGLAQFEEARASATSTARMAILLFHRVTDEIPPDGLTVGTAKFRAICAMLRDSCQVVPLRELVQLARSGQRVPRATVAITFDDSYHNNLPAARVLAEHGLPACFFLPTSYLGSDQAFPWDRGLPRQLSNLSWDDARELVRLGFVIGSHSQTHPNLAAVDRAQARAEIIGSKQILEERLQTRVDWFAYPFGGVEHFRSEWLSLVAEAGYRACFSAHGGFIGQGCAAPCLPREPVPYFDNVLQLELYLRGALHWFYSLKQQISGGLYSLCNVQPRLSPL